MEIKLDSRKVHYQVFVSDSLSFAIKLKNLFSALSSAQYEIFWKNKILFASCMVCFVVARVYLVGVWIHCHQIIAT